LEDIKTVFITKSDRNSQIETYNTRVDTSDAKTEKKQRSSSNSK